MSNRYGNGVWLAGLWLLSIVAAVRADEPAAVGPLIGFTERRTNLPGGRHANVRRMRAVVVHTDGTGRRPIAEELANEPDAWTQFTDWSPDAKQAIVSRGWQDTENARWEDEHKTFRMSAGKWSLDACLVDVMSGKVSNVTAVDRVSHYNGGLFFLPAGRGLGFTPPINGTSKSFVMDLDGRNKRDGVRQLVVINLADRSEFTSMPRDADEFDFFVSYARADNSGGWITRFVEELLAEHRKFSGGRELTYFFDKNDIRSFDDWQHRLDDGLAKSRLFLAFISPNFFASEYPGGRFLVPCDGKTSLRDAALSLGDLFRDQISDEERETAETYFAAIKDCLRERLDKVGHILLV